MNEALDTRGLVAPVSIGHLIVSRMASARFPGKAMAFLYGKPMIAWIIEKALSLGGPVAICATDDPLDEPLEGVARRYHIECARGPVDDFEAQYALATDLLGITHWIEWSGDSPFADPEIGRRIMALMHKEPHHDHYAAGPYPSGTTGVHVSGGAVSWLRKFEELRDDPRIKEYMAKGWLWYHFSNVIPGVLSSAQADIADLFDMPRSLFAMCVDYPLQLDLYNRIARWLGHFPTWQEIEVAYRKMRTLGGEL